jgi:hypothetical protein
MGQWKYYGCFDGPYEFDYPTDSSPKCEHEFVNVSFMQIRMVCKHCNEEQK